jgi:hypothetical protein
MSIYISLYQSMKLEMSVSMALRQPKLEICCDKAIDVSVLVETWHDVDSICFKRLRMNGYQVVDWPRPRAVTDDLSTNHGGVAVVVSLGTLLSLYVITVSPTSFEFTAAR